MKKKLISPIPWAKLATTETTKKAPWLKQKRNPKPKPLTTHTETGKKGEQIAKIFLIEQNLKFETTNYRCKCGEIDLIMSQEKTAIIVEVRVRNNLSYGSGLHSITQSKQKRILNCARLWWQKIGKYQFDHIRFDAIDVQKDAVTNWVKNAWLCADT